MTHVGKARHAEGPGRRVGWWASGLVRGNLLGGWGKEKKGLKAGRALAGTGVCS